MFPNLFRLTAQKNARVADLWDWDNGDGGWNPIFLRSFNDWEMEEVDRLLQVLYRKQIRPLMEDKILFKGSRNDAFSMKSNVQGARLLSSSGFSVSLNLESCHPAQNGLLRLGGVLGKSAYIRPA